MWIIIFRLFFSIFLMIRTSWRYLLLAFVFSIAPKPFHKIHSSIPPPDQWILRVKAWFNAQPLLLRASLALSALVCSFSTLSTLIADTSQFLLPDPGETFILLGNIGAICAMAILAIYAKDWSEKQIPFTIAPSMDWELGQKVYEKDEKFIVKPSIVYASPSRSREQEYENEDPSGYLHQQHTPNACFIVPTTPATSEQERMVTAYLDTFTPRTPAMPAWNISGMMGTSQSSNRGGNMGWGGQDRRRTGIHGKNGLNLSRSMASEPDFWKRAKLMESVVMGVPQPRWDDRRLVLCRDDY
ncbi:hypothetical protein CC80DRAFT_541632 [Byssothecium circinans]|uniref:Uncharacterized protein n=1 Tax=Byssothecium circinans TaxID=147558 RepID=A0A6A5ULC0_9PLEO|nr:hypothetical protein CC80DRAFT_541632 [Byssothecium circinans]